MKAAHKIGIIIFVLGVGGLSLFIALLVKHGAGDIAQAVAAAGWGLAAVLAFHLVVMACDVMSWRALIPREHRLSFWSLFHLRWMGDSVSAMLPVAQVGGEIVRVRLAAARGMPMPIAAATVLVGMTVCVATQIIFTLTGLGELVLATGARGIAGPVVVGSVIGVAALAGFYAVQRIGIFRMIAGLVRRIVRSDAWDGVVERGAALDEHVRMLYARRRELMACALWNMANWAAGAVEVWIALWALGLHAPYGHAYVLESVSQGIRSAMFLVPGALGVQEGGYLVVGGLLGIPPETALALALIKRVRELAFGIPGVLAWQFVEGKRLWIGRASAATPAAAVSKAS